ncbi:alkaline phosphatase D family protein [Pontiella sulfatireligans]|uniref:Alkaline phosphatase D n=1 Tax=Pontiella sulfatireligans TaxID=2750658 RepID=A0A6C2UHJ3_9BACT|nr:alkaline phosphatase D family protein [Pontiella sulfatireligans]VGO19665.1 Alkaline phosphatase D [Pontiella sulfatireligans]
MKTRCLLLMVVLICSTLVRAQHDPGRGAVRLLAKGQVDDAIKMAATTPKKKNSPISEAEHEYVLAMAYCQKGDAEAAFLHAQTAVQLGLPIERFSAGPRGAFQPLYDQPAVGDWIKENGSMLLHGPMLGSMTSDSVRIWVRTLEETDVSIEVESSEGKVVRVKGRSNAAQDYTAVIQVRDLKPNTEYRYRLLIKGEPVGQDASFKTFPSAGNAAVFRVAFGGGAGFTPQYERMWKTIGSHDLNALLLLGDNVYIDDPEHTLTQRYCYYRRQSQPDWRALVARVPVYTIYDDHDFGLNDCNPGPQIETPPWKRTVWEVYKQNWNNPSYGGESANPGCWYDFYIGDVHFIMLDCRYYRDLEGGSMLGPVQKKWLFQTLEKSRGSFKVLVSSVPYAPGVKPKSKDTWDGFADEREEIFSFIEEQKVAGVVLMSADRHRTDMRKIPRSSGCDLYEVMSSRLTNVHTHSLMEKAQGSEFIMGYNEKCSFGLMEFDTKAADPQVKFSMVSIDDEVIDSRTLKLSELTSSGATR